MFVVEITELPEKNKGAGVDELEIWNLEVNRRIFDELIKNFSLLDYDDDLVLFVFFSYIQKLQKSYNKFCTKKRNRECLLN